MNKNQDLVSVDIKHWTGRDGFLEKKSLKLYLASSFSLLLITVVEEHKKGINRRPRDIIMNISVQLSGPSHLHPRVIVG